MLFPNNIRIKYGIQQGAVYNFSYGSSSNGSTTKNRYFIVMNVDPKNDTAIILITPTTQVQKKYKFVDDRGISRDTIVEIKTGECAALTKDCAFNCNEVHAVSL